MSVHDISGKKLAPAEFDGSLKVLPGLIGFPAKGRRIYSQHDPHEGMGSSVVKTLIKLDYSFDETFNLGQICQGIR